MSARGFRMLGLVKVRHTSTPNENTSAEEPITPVDDATLGLLQLSSPPPPPGHMLSARVTTSGAVHPAVPKQPTPESSGWSSSMH
eukprot:CAMPEP_0185753696 /NCGR_PEP_ID=MMETSP1174-20130828/12419_1 /TAXON_ID=35687 /ORGANISM="Dictyocha speculum, Strain CCMP1381" /LENGTH=84 /DNA_ID=CAMNT_0028431663 /DNA_START=203 /DNA_END=454 /DNA_ORIENTATION=-